MVPLTLKEGQLVATLPDATEAHEVGRTCGYPAKVPRVDWAWDEPSRHYLCEVKDPEHPKALRDAPHAVERIRSDAAESWYAQELAVQAHHTTLNHEPSKRTPRTFIVLLGITPMLPRELVAVGFAVRNELRDLGTTASVLAVNVAGWNDLLAPRRLERI